MMATALETEVLTDPLARRYSGMTDVEVADSLNTRNISWQDPVPIAQVLRWSAGIDAIYTLRTASSTGPKDQRRIADAALQLINHPHIFQLDVTDPEIMAMLNGLVALGVFTQANIDSLMARGEKTISRAEELGLGFIAPGHVENARY